jgi:PPOX class probable F420-dependent enzyme
MTYQANPRLAERAGETIGWLTTVTPKNRPAPRPVWFVLDGDDIVVFSQPDTAKVRHIAANPAVSFNLNSNPTGQDILVISGTASTEPGKPSEVPEYLTKYQPSFARIGFTDTAAFDASYSVRIRIVPERSWGF